MIKVKDNKEKGITLIALVITIIVLLILAGVSISMISSQDGILNKTTDAKEKMNNAEELEQVQLAVMASYNNEGQIDYGKLKTELNKIKGITPITEEITSLPFVVNINGNMIQIRNNGTVGEYENLNILLKVLNTESDKISVQANVEGKENITYKYYIKTEAETDDKYVLKHEGKETTYEYTSLIAAESYSIKVEAIDENESKGEKILVQKTEKKILTVTQKEINTATHNITISVNVAGAVEGNITYKYYIKKSSEKDEQYVLEHTGTESNYTYSDLSSSSSYTLKIEAVDKNGNEGEIIVTAGTQCFVAGTKVLTEDGMKNIEDIEIGQKVYTINTDTNERELKEVTNIFRGTSDELYRLKIGDEIVSATPKHQFYIVDKGWVRAYDLKEGDKIVSKETQDLVIEKIEHEKLENPVKVYNLTIEGYHNYLITKYELLVHNEGSKE